MGTTKKLARAFAIIALVALTTSACTMMLPWPETSASTPSAGSTAPSTKPSTKPKPTLDPTTVEAPEADGAFDLYATSGTWLDNDYLAGIGNTVDVPGSICHVDPVEEIVIYTDARAMIAIDSAGNELWSLDDGWCDYNARRTVTAPLITLNGELVAVDAKTGTTTTLATIGESHLTILDAQNDTQSYVVSTDLTSTSSAMILGFRDGKQIWTMPSPFTGDGFLSCYFVDDNLVGCDASGTVAIIDFTTGKIVHTADTGGSFAEWGKDWYGAYSDDFSMLAFDFDGGQLLHVTSTYEPAPSEAHYSHLSLAGLDQRLDNVEAVTASGDTAVLYSAGELMLPDGTKLTVPSSSYVRSLTADGRAFLIESIDDIALVAANSKVIAKLTTAQSPGRVDAYNGVIVVSKDSGDVEVLFAAH